MANIKKVSAHRVLEMVEAGGMTFADMAKEIGCTRERVRQVAAAYGIVGADLRVIRNFVPVEETATCRRTWCHTKFNWMRRMPSDQTPTYCSPECFSPILHGVPGYCSRCGGLFDPKTMTKGGSRVYVDGKRRHILMCPDCAKKAAERSRASYQRAKEKKAL